VAIVHLNNRKPEDYMCDPRHDPYNVPKKKARSKLQGRDLLIMLRCGIFPNVCANQSMPSMNLVWVTCHIMRLFKQFEESFGAERRPLCVEAYEQPQSYMRRLERQALILAAMDEEDDEAMKLFAE
jgi:hypothetical protein